MLRITYELTSSDIVCPTLFVRTLASPQGAFPPKGLPKNLQNQPSLPTGH